MIRHLKPFISLLIVLVLHAGTPAADIQTGEYPETHQEDLFETYRALKSRVVEGKDVSAEVRRLAAAVHDHSFDSLLFPSEKTIQGLRLQEAGRTLWKGGENRKAERLLRESLEILEISGARSEAAFTCYLIAELCSEEERYPEALNWLDRASDYCNGKDRPYLEALIAQSYGYAYWFMDRLQASVLAFSAALVCWRKIGMQDGITVSWNNLASLYEELNLPDHARHCYEKAVASARPNLFEEVRFYLHQNFALFLLRQDDRSRGLAHLEEAGMLRHVSPVEFLIAEFQFCPDPTHLQNLLRATPGVPSVEVDAALAIGRYWLDRNNFEVAHQWLRSALEKSAQSGLDLLARRAAVLLGACLEKRGDYQAAAELYREHVRRNWNLLIPEVVFPYSETVSPLFDGWVRCLVHLDQEDEALAAIHYFSRIRKEKASRLRELRPPPSEATDELAKLAMASKLEISEPSLHFLPNRPDTSTRSFSYSVLELWPDGRQIYAWLTTPSGRSFLLLSLPETAARMVSEVIGGFYSTGGLLPASPSMEELQRLYRCLFQPIERSLAGPSLLVIPHKELQVLPLEILVDEGGRYLLQRYHFSYLPAWDQTRHPPQPLGNPVLVLPEDLSSLPESRRDALFFQKAFPSVRTVRDLQQIPLPAAWIHVSSHFELDNQFWLASRFSDGTRSVSALNLADANLECSLLSLGVCHVANGFSTKIPYWLGFCELFLSGRVSSLVVSRWEMDELAAPIYREFYLNCKRGKSMDEALSQARRNFLKKTLWRGKAKVSGRHPFFWAGINYLGQPGIHLFAPDPAKPLPLWLFTLLALACLALGGAALGTRSLCRHANSARETAPAVPEHRIPNPK
jgi:tetratricopeptide (TPR) repeat protein